MSSQKKKIFKPLAGLIKRAKTFREINKEYKTHHLCKVRRTFTELNAYWINRINLGKARERTPVGTNDHRWKNAMTLLRTRFTKQG